jgi:hypothetical protein
VRIEGGRSLLTSEWLVIGVGARFSGNMRRCRRTGWAFSARRGVFVDGESEVR